MIRLRSISDADLPFLRVLYASTREAELRQTGWSEAEKEMFCAMQFAAQHQHYMQRYAGDSFQLVLDDEEPVGRLYLGRWSDEIRVIDITIAPARRGQGLGARLLGEVQAEARTRGVPVRIHVERLNPARRLYVRLGFAPAGKDEGGVYELMEWRP